jgi:hypothetical protein
VSHPTPAAPVAAKPKAFTPPDAWKDSTPVERAAHLFECFYPGRAGDICEAEGISNADISAGASLAEERKQKRQLAREFYGDTTYGSRR